MNSPRKKSPTDSPTASPIAVISTLKTALNLQRNSCLPSSLKPSSFELAIEVISKILT